MVDRTDNMLLRPYTYKGVRRDTAHSHEMIERYEYRMYGMMADEVALFEKD
jgi:hypothetical protein